MKLTLNLVYAVLFVLNGILAVIKTYEILPFLGIAAILYGLSKLIPALK